MQLTAFLTAVGTLAAGAAAIKGPQVHGRRGGPKVQVLPRQLPAEPTGVQTIISPIGANITYKEPGKAGVCETTPGVNSYSGFINLAEDVHAFFWFFESRKDPANDPITLWLNGGPGSDSLIGLFQGWSPSILPCLVLHILTSCRAWTVQRHRGLHYSIESLCLERRIEPPVPESTSGRWLQLWLQSKRREVQPSREID